MGRIVRQLCARGKPDSGISQRESGSGGIILSTAVMGFVVHAVSDLRSLSVAVVAKSESLRSREMSLSQHEQRAALGRNLDWLIVDILLQILEIVCLLILGW